jgi:hypothetical protein
MYRRPNVSLDEWITLLAVATRLGFELVRAHAILAIDENPTPLDPIEKLVLATEHKIPQWLAPAYVALCQRSNPLEFFEAERIGLAKTVKIARAREAFRDADARSRPASPVYWCRAPALTPSPSQNQMIDYAATRAARVVDEVFFS